MVDAHAVATDGQSLTGAPARLQQPVGSRVFEKHNLGCRGVVLDKIGLVDVTAPDAAVATDGEEEFVESDVGGEVGQPHCCVEVLGEVVAAGVGVAVHSRVVDGELGAWADQPVVFADVSSRPGVGHGVHGLEASALWSYRQADGPKVRPPAWWWPRPGEVNGDICRGWFPRLRLRNNSVSTRGLQPQLGWGLPQQLG